MSRLKVVFSIGGMHGGGSERQIVSLLRSLDRDRFQPLLYLVYRSGPLLGEVPKDVAITSFEERFGKPRGPGILMHRKRVADMSQFLSEVSADVVYDRTFLMTLIAAEAAQRIGVPNVSTIVTDPPVGFPQVAGRFQGVKRRMLRRLYSNSTKVLANSEGAARSAERFYGLQAKVVEVHHNGVDLKDVQQKCKVRVVDDWWNASPNRRRVFRIVTAGRLDDKKGFHLLIDALPIVRKHHPDVEFRVSILGEGPRRDALERQIKSSGLQRQVRMPGFQTNAPAWYRSADLFVLPSLLEGMPNVLLEAMACGTPVLSADCDSGPREILADGRYGALCGVDSAESIAKGIRRFLADDGIRNRYTSLATLHVQQNFSISSAARKLEDIFTDAAAKTCDRPSG